MTEQDDADQLRYIISPESLKYLPMIPPNMTLADVAARRESQAASGNFKVFKMNKTATGEFIGCCGLYRMEKDNFAFDCGLGIFAEFHRNGFATEALFLVLDHGFTDLGFNRTTFVTNAKNEGMRKWLENAAGAVQEGYFRESWFDAKVDTWDDSVQYGILKSEWEGGMREKLLDKVRSADKRTKLRDLGNGFFNLRAPFTVGYVLNVGTHMSFIKLSSGRFVALSTVDLDADSKQEIDALTDNGDLIEAVIATNPFHTMAFEGFHKAYPNAKYYGTPRHIRNIKNVVWAGSIDENLNNWASEIELSIPAGCEFNSPQPELFNHFCGVVALHKASRFVICDDAFETVKNQGFLTSLASGLKNGDVRFHPSFQSHGLLATPEAPQQFFDWMQRLINEWDWDNLCTAHSGVVVGGSKEKLREAFVRITPFLASAAKSRGGSLNASAL
ncbi:hypothetical protein HDU98_003545 [Podochytrium sp. JEL0797]|nr:hypothetical protein HDU98_003545 [Podochytrium sp. JEL0797]